MGFPNRICTTVHVSRLSGTQPALPGNQLALRPCGVILSREDRPGFGPSVVTGAWHSSHDANGDAASQPGVPGFRAQLHF